MTSFFADMSEALEVGSDRRGEGRFGPRVVVTYPLFEEALRPLVDPPLCCEVVMPKEPGRMLEGEELISCLEGARALLCLLSTRVDETLLRAAPDLLVVSNVAVGFDNIDLDACTKAGVLATNTPGVLDETTADSAFGLMIAASRLFSAGERALRAGEFHSWSFDGFLGQDIYGATLGIVGYGRIGRALAKRALGFDMQVLHWARHPTGEEGYVGDLDELLAASDFVSLHVPLASETHHLINARRLSLMKPTAVLVNTSRGPVVDEEALGVALERREIFAVGLDVYEHEPKVDSRLLRSPWAVLLPHIGSASFATRFAMAKLAASSAAKVLMGEKPEHVLNPRVTPKSLGARQG
jgi:glyoxylate reductase